MSDLWYSVLFGAAFGLAAYFLLLLDEKQSLAPDSAYYLALGDGKKVPTPFCFRWLVPRLCGTNQVRWQIATALGIVLQSIGIILYTHGDWRAPLLLGGLPALWRFSIRHPILIDPLPMGIAILGAALPISWYWTLPLALVAGAMRETAPLWMVVFAWHPLPVLGGLSMFVGLRFWRAVDKQDNLWISQPYRQALIQRRGHWLNWRLMIIPWGVVLPLALLAADWRVLAVALVGYLPLIRSSDYARIYQWSAPVLIAAALTVDTPYWPLLLLLHWSNGYRGA